MGARSARLVTAAAVILGTLAWAPTAAAEGCETDPACAEPPPCADPACEPSCADSTCPGPCDGASCASTCTGNSTCQQGHGGGSHFHQAVLMADTARACKPVSISGGRPELGWDPILGIIRVNQCVFDVLRPTTSLPLPLPPVGG